MTASANANVAKPAALSDRSGGRALQASSVRPMGNKNASARERRASMEVNSTAQRRPIPRRIMVAAKAKMTGQIMRPIAFHPATGKPPR
jgi:hypothetical protein